MAVPETPPAPPPAGSPGAPIKPQPAPPRSFADESAGRQGEAGGSDSIAGWHGMFYLRDPDGLFRISPRGLVELDFGAFLGSGVSDKSTASGGAGLSPYFHVRRLRLGFAGEFLTRWNYELIMEFGQSLDNRAGPAQVYAAKPGEEPSAETARYRDVEGPLTSVTLLDVNVGYSFCDCLNFTLGQFRPPISMENRTSQWALPLMERSLAVRTFVVPAARETGLMVSGDIGENKLFSYEVMVAGGDGQNRTTVDAAPDFIGRLLLRPLGSVKLIKNAHIGVSARHGERDPEAVGYPVTGITTGQGYTMMTPAYTDSQGRRISVIPSGGQNIIGGELRLPIGPVDVRGEAYYVSNHTREAVNGFELTNTERLGTMNGFAFTGVVDWWALGDEYISGDPGYKRPSKLNLKKKVEIQRGLQLTGLVSAVIGAYDGNARGGTDDASTPGSAENPASDFAVWQFSAAASYWHSKWVRMMLQYSLYYAPDSGSTENLAVVPGNVVEGADPGAHVLHELGTRLQLWF